MAILKLKKREEPILLFGLKMPEIVRRLYNEIRNEKVRESVIRETLNIKEDRLINFTIAIDSEESNINLILVIYDNFVTEKEKRKMDIEIEHFNFDIFRLDYNSKIDVEDIIERFKTRY